MSRNLQAQGLPWHTRRAWLAGLVAAQVVGLNLWAWHERSAIEARRSALQTLVKQSFPRVNDVDIQRDPA